MSLCVYGPEEMSVVLSNHTSPPFWDRLSLCTWSPTIQLQQLANEFEGSLSSLPLEPEWQPVCWGSNSGPTQALHSPSHLPSPECGLQHNFWLVHIICQASICPVSSTKATVSKQEATAYGLKVPWLWQHHSIDDAFTVSSLWPPGHCSGIQNAATANWSRMTVCVKAECGLSYVLSAAM